jgi:hypothetical protein
MRTVLTMSLIISMPVAANFDHAALPSFSVSPALMLADSAPSTKHPALMLADSAPSTKHPALMLADSAPSTKHPALMLTYSMAVASRSTASV